MRSGQNFAEVVDTAHLIVKFDATPEDLRFLKPGSGVRITIPAYPEVRMEGVVDDVAAVGAAQGRSTSFAAIVRIERPHPLARAGLDCQIYADSMIRNVLLVPKNAIRTEYGRSHCTVLRGEAQEEVAVTIGASDEKFTEILEGLREGDEVVVPAN